MRSNLRIKRALEDLKFEITLYEEMLEKRFRYGKLNSDELRELLEEISYLESAYGFFREQVSVVPKRKKRFMKLDLIAKNIKL